MSAFDLAIESLQIHKATCVLCTDLSSEEVDTSCTEGLRLLAEMETLSDE